MLVIPGDPDENGVGAVRRVWIGPLPFRHEGGSIRLEPDGAGTHALWTSSFEIPIPVIGQALDRIFKVQLERGFAQVLQRSAELWGPT